MIRFTKICDFEMVNFDLCFRHSPLFSAIVDETGVCRDINTVWREYLGLPGTGAVSYPFEALFSRQDDAVLRRQIIQVIQNGTVMSGRPVSLSRLQPEQDGVGSVVLQGVLSTWRIKQAGDKQYYALLVFIETAEYSRAVNQFNQLQKMHELILNAVGEGIYGVDAQGNTTFVNEAATRILGWRAEDVIGKSLHDIHHHSYPTAGHTQAANVRFIARLQMAKYTAEMKNSSGARTARWFLLNIPVHLSARMVN